MAPDPRQDPIQSIGQLRQLLRNPRTFTFQSPTPANTAAPFANLYHNPNLPFGELPFAGAGAGAPTNSAASVSSLFAPASPPTPFGELPPGGSTGIYNNRFLSAQAKLGGPGVTGGTTAGGAVPTAGALPRVAGQAATGATGALGQTATGTSRFLNPARPITFRGNPLPGALGRGGLAAGAARGLGYGMLGSFAADFAEQAGAPEGTGGALRGAGLGAAAGPWGAGIGALLGGVSDRFDIPVLSDIFGGGEQAPELPPVQERFDAAVSNIQQAFQVAGIPPSQAQTFFNNLQANLLLEENPDEALERLLTPAEDGQLPPLLADAQALISQGAQQQTQLTPEDIALIQAQVGQFLTPLQQQVQNTGNIAAAALTENMGNLSPQYQDALRAQAATQRANASRFAAAIQAQGQVLPAITAHQQAIAQAFQTPRGSSGSSLEEQLAALGLAG